MQTQIRRSFVRGRAGNSHGRVTGPLFVALLIVTAAASLSCRRSTPASPPAQAQAAPPPAAPQPTVSLTASPTSVNAGQNVTLQWQSQNANAVQIDPGIGAVASSGMQSVSPASSVTYTARATGPGGTATATVRVTVNTPPPAPPTDRPAPAPSMEELFRTNVVPVYFDYDRADVRADQVSRLQASARFLQQNAGIQFTIGGHADERGSQEYNIGLGDRRANAVRQFLVAQGIAASRINTVSYGEERSVCTQSNENCWSQNRRAEFTLR